MSETLHVLNDIICEYGYVILVISIVVDFYILVTMSEGAHHTFFISLLIRGVSNSGSSGVEGQFLGRGGEPRSFFPFSGGEDGTRCFSNLNPGVQNTGSSGDSRLSGIFKQQCKSKREAWRKNKHKNAFLLLQS